MATASSKPTLTPSQPINKSALPRTNSETSNYSGLLPTAIVGGHDLTSSLPVFSHDAKYVFCCCAHVIRVFVKATGAALHDLRGHTDVVTSVARHPKNRFQIFSSSLDKTIILWDFEDGLLLRRFFLDINVPILGLHIPDQVADDSLRSAYALVQTPSDFRSDYALLRGPWPGANDPTFALDASVFSGDCPADPHGLASGWEGQLVVAVNRFQLLAYDAKMGRMFKHRNKQDKMISVSCNPRLPMVVVGCHNGKILVITDLLRKGPITRVVYHWHSLPVTAVAFTRQGTHFLSGGHECVLVRWNVEAAGDRQYMPRLGAAIRKIAVSPDNDYYAASMSDNAVAVIASTRRTEVVFGGMVKCPFKRARDDGVVEASEELDVPSAVRLSCVPTGLHVDPRSGCLVLNGRLGHLQFHDLEQNRNLPSLDILELNFVSPDSLDGGQILAEVKLIAFDERGEWLVTVRKGRRGWGERGSGAVFLGEVGVNFALVKCRIFINF